MAELRLSVVLTIRLKNGIFEYTAPVATVADALGPTPSVFGQGLLTESYMHLCSTHNTPIPTRDDGQTTAQLALRAGGEGSLLSFPFFDGGLRKKKQGAQLHFEHMVVTLSHTNTPRSYALSLDAHDALKAILAPRFTAIGKSSTMQSRKRKANEELARIAKERRLLDKEQVAAEEQLALLEAEPARDLFALFK